MDKSMHELKNVLQILALPVTGQVYLLKEDCTRVEVLANTFDDTNRKIRNEDGSSLTPGRAAALARLEERLAQVRQRSPMPICSELSMRQSAGWRQVQATARETLTRFDWPLEIPLLTLPVAR